MVCRLVKQKNIRLFSVPRCSWQSFCLKSRIFWKVIIPAAGPGIASGTVLAFARAIGEYGATSMLAGNILGKTRTVSVAIAAETAAGNYGTAGFWVVVIVLISFVIVALINIVSGRGMKTRRWI